MAASPAEQLPEADRYAQIGRRMFAERRFADAIDAYESALNLRPDHPAVLSNLGAACSLAGQAEKSELYFRRAIRIAPHFLPAVSNLLLSLHYDGRWTPDQIAAQHKTLGASWNQAGTPLRERSNIGGRRLRVGYVSSDFRRHPVSCFIEPVLANHNHQEFEIFCYYSAPVEDSTTERIRLLADHWRPIADLDDEHAAALIRQDECDILVDLNGHTHGNRLGVFARQPAPVQATYAGYPDGTGLKAMQYQLTDAIADPAGPADMRYTEKLVRLPGSYLCYRPPTNCPPVDHRPEQNTERFWFGSLNQYQKLSDFTVELWAELLRVVPDSGLILQSMSMDDPRTAASLCERFERFGVDRRRLDLAGYSRNHLATYNKIDLALDTFPFHGCTTTCEALWMGVPVVSLQGELHVSRMTTTILAHTGLDQFIASTREEYLEIARRWAENRSELARLRSQLREQIVRSPLRDEPGFTRAFEGALVRMAHT